MKKRILAAVVAAAMLLTAALPCALAEREDISYPISIRMTVIRSQCPN